MSRDKVRRCFRFTVRQGEWSRSVGPHRIRLLASIRDDIAATLPWLAGLHLTFRNGGDGTCLCMN